MNEYYRTYLGGGRFRRRRPWLRNWLIDAGFVLALTLLFSSAFGASGDTLAVFQASAGTPPSTSFAPLSRRNSHLVANYDAAADENLDFDGVLPANYDGGGITITLVWMAATATSGNVIWNAQVERHSDDDVDLDSDSFAAANASSAVAAPTATGEVSYDTITFTDGADMDSLAAGESYRLRITRDANNGSDTMAGDAQLMRVEVGET